MEDILWLIPALPLLGFGLLVAFGRRLGEPLAGWLATAMVGASFVVTAVVFAALLAENTEQRVFEQRLFTWVVSGELSVDFGFLAGPISITMALFITGVSTLIHMYAIGYMHGDRDFSKFFVYLNLFVFFMLVLVLGDNMLVTFLGWEGVGACSYLLISFWFSDKANATAGKKAFITNRVGDLGFLLAIFLVFMTVGSVRYSDIFLSIAQGEISQTTATAIVLLLLVAVAGKSAQFPLYLWLPDAMAGPTPVSALIHAATMVTAGVYLLDRMTPLIAAAEPWTGDVIAWVGLFTALFAASIAVAQNDIKKVLAYSTISQLGFMVVAVGSGLYVAALFHTITHAFFKALLFLGAGSVIHGMDDEQDMRRMGGLWKLMPITAVTFMIGWLAIAGVPPFSGFWSKDDILLAAWNNNRVLWGLLLLAAVLTAFYMTRLVIMTFFGEREWDEDEVHPHDPPWTMSLTLIILSVLAVFGGLLNLPFTSDTKFLEKWLEPVLLGNEVHVGASTATKWIIAIISVIGVVLAIALAFVVYLRRRIPAEKVEAPVLAHGWYYDEAVTNFMGGPGRKFFDFVTWFDKTVIDGTVNGAASLSKNVGDRLRYTQTGLVRTYAVAVAGGAVILLGYFLLRAVA